MAMTTTPLARELVRLRLAASLTPQQVAAQSRGKLTGECVMLCEGGHTGTPAIPDLRVFARIYRTTAWSLMKLAGYVTDQDAIDGMAEIKRTARRVRRAA
jgi:hypothetical protein